MLAALLGLTFRILMATNSPLNTLFYLVHSTFPLSVALLSIILLFIAVCLLIT